MSNDTTVGAVLSGLRRRQRALNTICWGLHGLLIGAIAGCGGALVAWATANPGTLGLVLVALACAGAGAAIGTVVGAVLPVRDLDLARALDRASSSEDRFASAMQLAAHHRRERVKLVIEDAMARVRGTAPKAALPIAVPRTARWLPLPVLVLAALLALLPAASQRVVASTAPEITPDEWASINDEFNKELALLPKPQTPEEEELQKQLQRLAELLKQNPEKKDALKEIARLSDKVAERRKAVGTRRSMKSAAKAVASSKSLKEFASKLKEGAYDKASSDLKKLSEQMKKGEISPEASEFESMAADLQRLSEQMAEDQEMQQECQNCANAANSMNREQLAEALKRLAEQMEKNAKKMSECDNLGECNDLLEQLKRMMNQCKSCQGNKPGEGFCEGEGEGQRAGRGGLKPGWGTAAKWDGGSLKPADEGRIPDLENPQERQGVSSTFQIVSPDERAKSGKKYEELYAEFVQKTEADLDLESVPVAYREYLKRYFNSIRPEETPREGEKPSP